MGEIRFVGTGETREYPYPVCKKEQYSSVCRVYNLLSRAHGLSLHGKR